MAFKVNKKPDGRPLMQRLKELYDGFKVKDMSFVDFVAHYKAASDQTRMARDFQRIQMQIAARGVGMFKNIRN